MDYRVDLQVFRGPLDLLLHLVKRHEVDIFDIPIAQIAEQFLAYLNILQQIDVEQAGDFLVMASTLMEIKSRLLLPKAKPDAEATPTAEEADPRAELVRQLVAYKKFRDAAERLEALADQQALRLPRGRIEKPPTPLGPGDQPLQPVEIWDLVSAFERLMRATQAATPDRTITFDDTPQQAYAEELLSRLARAPRLAFAEAFAPPHTRGRLIGLFLALLELIKARQVVAEQAELFGEIWLSLPAAADTPPMFDQAA